MTQRSKLNLRILLVIVLLILVVVRLALPFIAKKYVNRELQKIPGYTGSVEAIRLNLFRAAYTLLNLRIKKTGGKVPVPFFSTDRLELSIQWRELLRGNATGKVALDRPSLNFVQGPTSDTTQTGIDRNWRKTLEALQPFTINRFQITDGIIRYAAPYRTPPVDIYVTNIVSVATNLTNVRRADDPLPASLTAQADTTGDGELKLEIRLNPLAETPTFKLAASMTGLELPALNDFFRSYADVDTQSGRFWVYLNLAAADGRYHGIAKPFFINTDMITWKEFKHQNVLQSFWESLAGAVADLFQNQPTGRLATRVPVDGAFDSGTQIDLWSAIGGVLRNAFIQALRPGIPGPVRLPANPPEVSGSP